MLFLSTSKTLAQNPSTESQQKKQSTASKQVSTFNIDAPQLQTTKKIWIYLPKNYDSSKKKYPVIYMHDAQNLFDAKTSFVGEWNVDEKLDSLKAQVIVVGIEHGNEKREEELTPYKNAIYGGGNANNYLEFIVKTLKPEIDAKYRTKTKAKNTAIMGSSLGGLASFYAALKYPNVFGKVGCFSPSFWFCPKEMNALMAKTKVFKTKVFFLCGDSEGANTKDSNEGMILPMKEVEHWVNTKRCECKKLNKEVIVKGGQHNEKLWRDGFAKAYLWLF